jgi:TonB-dependent starch-binding outer membrane protein SusC
VSIDANGSTRVFGDGTRIGSPSLTQPGSPIAQFRGYIQEGLWTTQEQINTTLFASAGDAKVGRFRFRDINKDGQINDDDIVNIGNPLPKFQLGLNLTANYKNFDVSAYFNGKYGNKNFNFIRYFSDFPAFQANYSKAMLYEAGKTLPVLDANDNYSSRLSSAYVESGSFTRLSNLVIGYTLPASVTQRYGVEKIRFYVQGQNLFTLTNYSGLDPDIGLANLTEGFASRRDLTIGLDNGRYPWSRTFLIGANIQF